MDSTRRKRTKMFEVSHLNLDIESNLKSVIFLGVTFDLNNATRQPNGKQNCSLIYINIKSDRLKTMTKHIYESIAHKLATNSNNIEIFNNCVKNHEKHF